MTDGRARVNRVLTTAKNPTGREVWFTLRLPFGRHFTAYAMLINTREVDRIMRDGFEPPDEETKAWMDAPMGPK